MSLLNIILVFICIFVTVLFWRQNNKVAIVLSIILTILIVIFHKQIKIPISFYGIDEINKSSNTLPFISSKWRDSSLVHSDPPVRIGMIENFVMYYKPYQKNKVEIIKLLGKPDYSEELKEWDLVYWLGEEQGLINSYSHWFVIEFDSSGLVSEFQTFKF